MRCDISSFKFAKEVRERENERVGKTLYGMKIDKRTEEKI